MRLEQEEAQNSRDAVHHNLIGLIRKKKWNFYGFTCSQLLEHRETKFLIQGIRHSVNIKF